MTAMVADVEDVLESRQEWILQKLYGLQEQAGPPYPKEYMTGEKLNTADDGIRWKSLRRMFGNQCCCSTSRRLLFVSTALTGMWTP